jgi:hypothetical protein
MERIKNIYLNHNYRSPYNLILLDECIPYDLYNYLKENLHKYFTKDFTILSVNYESKMKEMNDKDLADFCYDYNGVLVTSDLYFFNKYHGYKIFYSKNMSWNKIIQKSVKFLTINSSKTN